MAAKRTVEVVAAAPIAEPSAADVAAEATEQPREKATPQRGPTGQFLPASKPTEREWKPDSNPFESMRGQYKPPADGEAPPAETPDPDATPPGEEAPAEETPPAAAQGVEVPTAYLTAEQRKELATRLEQSKAERHKDTELQRMQRELETAQRKSPLSKAEFLRQAGYATQEDLLEALLIGKDVFGAGDAPPSKPIDPELAAVKAELAQMKQERDQEKQAAMVAASQAEIAGAIQVLQTNFTKDSHPMIATLRQYGALWKKCDGLYDGATNIHHVAQLAAAELEDQLRKDFPDVAAMFPAGPAPAKAPPVAATAAALAKPKPSVGSRGGAVATPPAEDGPMDSAERTIWVKQRQGWKTF